eukprot:scaffold7247_cov484-Prasinococcus_capsulatus_cf.AAC.3
MSARFCRRDELLCGTPLLPGRVHQDVNSPGRLPATDASALPFALLCMGRMRYTLTHDRTPAYQAPSQS